MARQTLRGQAAHLVGELDGLDKVQQGRAVGLIEAALRAQRRIVREAINRGLPICGRCGQRRELVLVEIFEQPAEAVVPRRLLSRRVCRCCSEDLVNEAEHTPDYDGG